MARVQSSALPKRVRRSALLSALGKVGYGARAVVFAVLGLLVVATSFGMKESHNDPIGALERLARAPLGVWSTALVGVGLGAYVVWNVAVGVATSAEAWRKGSVGRVLVGVGYALTGACYAPLGWAALLLANGERTESTGRDVARLFDVAHGRLVVGVVGGALVVAGVVQIVIALGRTFIEPLHLGSVSRRRLRVLLGLGMVGFTARAALFALVGGLLVRAAVLARPAEARGPDRALDLVLTLPNGAWILLPLGIGLVAFALFSVLAVQHLPRATASAGRSSA